MFIQEIYKYLPYHLYFKYLFQEGDERVKIL